MRPRSHVLLLTAALLGWPALAAAQSPAPTATRPAGGKPAKHAAAKRAAEPPLAAPASRDAIETLEDRLDRAADRVSAPQLMPMLGRRSGARGFRLPGYGVVVVLTPRALPGPDAPDVTLLRPRHRVKVETRTGAVRPEEAEELEAIERQVILLQHESEAARRAAEETQQRIVETVRWRFGSPGDVTIEVSPAPEAVAPMAAPPEAPAAPPSPAVPPAPPAPIAAPVPPPWKYWFSVEGPRDSRAPEAVVADVRAALVEALASHPGGVTGLGPDEFVTVAVDFEEAAPFARRPRPEHTLVVRARVRDMEARAAGAIAAEEMRRRLEILEY